MKVDAELIARCLAKEAKNRRDNKRGYPITDELAEALEYLDYTSEAERLSVQGAQIVGGKLVI